MELTLQQLKEIATKLNYSYHHNIGAEKLKEQLIAHAIELGTTFEEVVVDMNFQPTQEQSDIKKLEASISNIPASDKLMTDEVERLSKLTFSGVEASQAGKNEQSQYKEAMRLIRCTITCNNKNKASYQGEIFCVRNAVLPEIKKMIPFNVPTHIPKAMLNMIKEKQCQMFKKEKLPNGSVVTKPFLVPEYNIQELPPLTSDELEAIKKKQLAEGFTGE